MKTRAQDSSVTAIGRQCNQIRRTSVPGRLLDLSPELKSAFGTFWSHPSRKEPRMRAKVTLLTDRSRSLMNNKSWTICGSLLALKLFGGG